MELELMLRATVIAMENIVNDVLTSPNTQVVTMLAAKAAIVTSCNTTSHAGTIMEMLMSR